MNFIKKSASPLVLDLFIKKKSDENYKINIVQTFVTFYAYTVSFKPKVLLPGRKYYNCVEVLKDISGIIHILQY